MVNVYKDTIPRFHRDPSKKKKKKLEMGSVAPQSSLIDCCSKWCGGIHKRCRLVKRSSMSAVHLLIGNQVKSPLSEGLLNSRYLDHEYYSRHLLEIWSFWAVLRSFWFLRWCHPQQRKKSEKLMIKFNKNGQGEEKLLLNMNCRFMLLITKMENHRLIFQFVLRSPRVKNKITVNAKQIVNLWSLEKEDKKDGQLGFLWKFNLKNSKGSSFKSTTLFSSYILIHYSWLL